METAEVLMISYGPIIIGLIVRLRQSRRFKLLLGLICLGFLIAFPISEIKTAGKLQEVNDAAAHNAKGRELSQSGIFEQAIECFLPYQVKSNGQVVYGRIFAQKGQAKIFRQP
jgi:hypothetical protein